jgi:hypothetical protein
MLADEAADVFRMKRAQPALMLSPSGFTAVSITSAPSSRKIIGAIE